MNDGIHEFMGSVLLNLNVYISTRCRCIKWKVEVQSHLCPRHIESGSAVWEMISLLNSASGSYAIYPKIILPNSASFYYYQDQLFTFLEICFITVSGSFTSLQCINKFLALYYYFEHKKLCILSKLIWID